MHSGKKRKNAVLSAVLPEVVHHKGWDVKLDMHSFFPHWESVVDESVSCCSRPLKIVRNVLWLEVENSTWMQQLQFDKTRILEAVNATLKLSKIRDIKFQLPLGEEKKPAAGPPDLEFITPDPQELSKFEEQVAVIEDDATREALVRLWYLSKACRRKKGG